HHVPPPGRSPLPLHDALPIWYNAAAAGQRTAWANAYTTAVTKVKFVGGAPVVPPANDGPVPVMMATELTMARSGALDADLLAQRSEEHTSELQSLTNLVCRLL